MDRRANVIKSAMSRVGARPYGKQVKAEGKKERPWILRNIDKWIVAEPFEVSEEGMKGRLKTVLEDPDLAGFGDKDNPDVAPAKATPIAAEMGGIEQLREVRWLVGDVVAAKGLDFASQTLFSATGEEQIPNLPYDFSKLKTALEEALEGAKALPISAERLGEEPSLEIIDLYGDLVKAKGRDFARETFFSATGDNRPYNFSKLKTALEEALEGAKAGFR